MDNIFLTSLWPGLALWIGLYISDYYLTVSCARMYRAQEKFVFEGSFELNPVFQNDIDTLKSVSPRFITFLCLTSMFLWFFWHLTVQPSGLRIAYHFILGYMIMIELAIHVRHLRNWFLVSKCVGGDGIRGHIEYSRGILLRISAVEFLLFAGVFSILFLITSSLFILGGATSCSLTAWKHYRLAQKYVIPSTAVA